MPLSDEQKRENKLNKTFERYKALTIGNCKNDALKEFQKLRRIECANANGEAACISCGKVCNVSEMDGGHYISRAKTITAFSPLCVWAQCKHCNQHLSGNLVEYRKGLITKIGIEAVEFLESIQNEEFKPSKWQYAVRREYYRSKIKSLII
jgi:hypothetical protein